MAEPSWEPAERVQKNDAGEYRALIGGEWVPVAKAQKSDAGEFRVMRSAVQKPAHLTGVENPDSVTSQWGSKFKPSGESTVAKLGLLAPELPIADVATGASGMMRGIANLASKPFGMERGLGDAIWPKAPGSQGSGGKFVGELLDPLSWVAGGAVGKVLPYAPVLGNGLMQGAKAVTQNVLGGAATGGTIGALSDEGTALGGATGGAIAGGVAPLAIAGAQKVVGPIWDAMTRRYGSVIAGKIARDAAGGDLNAIKMALAAAPKDETAAQAAAGVKSDLWSALGEFARSQDKTSSYSRQLRQQAENRMGALKGVQPNMVNAVAERELAAGPLYAKARSAGNVVNAQPVMDKIDDLLTKNPGNTELVNALTRIKTGLTDDAGNIRVNAQEVASVMDGIKALLANKDNRFIVGQLTDVKNSLSKSIPLYDAAQAAFAKKSQPVNQSEVIDAMTATLAKPGGGERAAPFLNVLGKGEEAMLKKATGFPRYEAGDLPNIMTPRQMKVIDKVASDLERDFSIKEGAARGTGGLASVLKENTSKFHIPNFLDPKVALTNRALSELEGRINKSTMDKLVAGMQSGKGALELINTLPTAERMKVMDALARQAATIGAANANNNAPLSELQRTGY